MAFPFRAVAVWAFESANEGEMSLEVGDVVEVTGEAEGGWYVCTNSAGETGYVPQTYIEAQEEANGEVKSPRKSRDGKDPLKKRVSKKKIDGGAKLKAPSEEAPKKKKSKPKDGTGEEKKPKKASTSDVSDAAAPTVPKLDISPSPPSTQPTSPETTSPRSARPLPATPGAASASSNDSSPRNFRSGPPPMPAAISPRSTAGSVSNPPKMPVSTQPTSATPPQNAASPSQPKTASSPPPTGGSSSPADRRPPPAVPQKRPGINDSLRGASKSVLGAEPPAVPKKNFGTPPPTTSDSPNGTVLANNGNANLGSPAGANSSAGPSQSANSGSAGNPKASVPMPPPRGTRPGTGTAPPLPSSISQPRLNTGINTGLNSPNSSGNANSVSSAAAAGLTSSAGATMSSTGNGLVESGSSTSLHSNNSSSDLVSQNSLRSGSSSLASSTSQLSLQPPGASSNVSPSRMSHGRSSSSTMSPIAASDVKAIASQPRPTIPTLRYDNEKDQRRYFIVTELLTTERTYVSGLEDGVLKYFRPLLAAAQNKSPQHIEDVKSVFSVMEHLVPLNQNLMLSLEERILNWSPTTQRIGDIFVKVAPFLKMYTTYSNNYDTALNVLARLSHEPFFTAEPGFTNRVVESILITPIQRIPRYSLLLSDLLSNTNEDHADYGDIAKSLAVIKDVADHVNKGVGLYKNVARLTEAGLAHLLAPHRSLIRDSNITVVKTNSEKKSKKHLWHLILFSDVIVFINQALDENLLPKKDKKGIRALKIIETKEKERKEIVFPLYLVWLDDPGLRTGFDLLGPNQRMNLYFATADERDEWWHLLEIQVRQTLEKTEQLQSGLTSPATQQLQRKGRHVFTDYDEYDGQWDNGRIHGKGRMTCLGATYEGVFDGKYEVGSGTITYPTGMRFSGEWKAGKPTANGTMEYSTGEVYVGEFKDGKRSGKGTLTYKNGSVLECEWKADMAHGSGNLNLVATNVTYTGAFAEGKFCGAGTLVNAKTGAKYEGAFKDNWRHGKGKMTHADGACYDGDWKDDRQHGSGKWTAADGSYYEGDWKADVKDGKGHMRWPCGDEFGGSWLQGRPHGTGVFTYKSSALFSRYEGEVHTGKRHGKGTATYTSGAKYEGDWAEDLPQGNGKMTLPNGITIEGKWNSGVADQKCIVSSKGTPLVPVPGNPPGTAPHANAINAAIANAIAQLVEAPFPVLTEVPLIPTFDTAITLAFTNTNH